MTAKTVREHAGALDAFATASQARSAADPGNWLLSVIARNQRDSSEDAARSAAVAEALEAGELLEWRFVGNRLRFGVLPLEFLSRLAAPLNSLLIRSSYYARHRAEAMYGAAEEISREISLSVVGLAPGSSRVFIRGNATPDLTGSSAFSDGVEGIFAVLSHSGDAQAFYEHLDDIGERASEALHDTLKALEAEECSVEIRWHGENPREFQATFDRVVQLRALLQGIGEAQERHERLAGRITLLAVNGRLQLELDDGRKVTVRFRPRTQAELIADLTLNAPVVLDVSAKVTTDPISGDEIRRYSLVSLDSPLLSGSQKR